MSDEFCKILINNFTEYCEKVYGYVKYPNQNQVSCQAIVDSCLEINPDFVLDIGTNFGASTLSLAYGLKKLGKGMSELTTIDYNHAHWIKETPLIQKNLLIEHGINIDDIHAVCSDFQKLDPQNFVKQGKALIFYDIHDTINHSFMSDFVDKWIPILMCGRVMAHDFSLVKKGYVLSPATDPNYPRIMIEHFSGDVFAGFKECETLIQWTNKVKKPVFSIPGTSIIGFNL